MRNNYILAIALAAVAICTTANAGIIRVPADQPTVQAGLNAAAVGDTVLVSPGTYIGGLSCGKAISLIAESGPELTRLEHDGITLHLSYIQSDTFLVSGFEMVSNGNRAIASDFSLFQVENCLFTRSALSVIHFSGSSGTIRNCRFVDNAPDHSGWVSAIFVDNLGKTRLERNVFYGLSYPHVFYTTAERVDVINNTVVSCGGGFNVSSSYGSPGVVYNNVLFDLSGVAIVTSGSGPAIDYNLYYENGTDVTGGSAGINSVFLLDPQLSDTAAGDFTPLPGSPVMDAGEPSPEYNDLDGTRNDIGAIPSIRAFPYVVGLKVEGEERTHVLSHTPSIVWGYRDTLMAQSAFEVEFGTDNDWTVAELWDPAPTSSTDTTLTYSGSPLVDGQTVYLRVRVHNGVDWSYWTSTWFHMNAPPSAPTLNSPTDGASLPIREVFLQVNNSTDAEGDLRFYDFELYSDVGLNQLERSFVGVSETPVVTSTDDIEGLEPSAQYWWRARASDAWEPSDWSTVRSFTPVPPDTLRVPGDQPTIQQGIDAVAEYGVVLVAPGIYSESLIYGTRKVQVLSEGGPSVTTLTAPNPGANVANLGWVGTASTRLTGFSIVGGSAAPHVIYVSGGVPVIEHNVIRDFLSPAPNAVAVFVDGGNPYIRKNVFHGNMGISCVGIFQGTARVVNNTMDSNARGVFSNSGQGTVINNNITNSQNYGIAGTMSAINYNNVWGNNPNYTNGAAAGDADLSADPLYSDPNYAVYTLLNGSPCIDAGDPNAIYNDADGSRADIGALGLVSGLPLPLNISLFGEDRMHVIGASPTICWQYFDTLGTQSAFELEIGTDSDWSIAEQWASGTVMTADSCVNYTGEELVDGMSYWLRVRLSNGTNWGQWTQTVFRMNSAPTTPIPSAPVDGAEIRWNSVVLTADNAADAEGDPLRYSFEVSEDPSFNFIVNSFDSLTEGVGTTSTPTLPELGQYQTFYWRCRVSDGFEPSPWSAAAFFETRGPGTIFVPTDAPTLQAAVNMTTAGETISILPGTYTGTTFISGKRVHVISRDGLGTVTLESAGDLIVINNFSSTTPIVFDGLEFRTSGGRGVASSFADFEIRNCRFLHAGGSMLHFSGELGTLRNCEFYEMSSQHGGSSYGILIDNFGQLVMERCIFYELSYPQTFLTTSGSVSIVNNTFYQCQGGLDLTGGAPVAGAILNNVFAFISGTAITTNASGPYIDYNLYYFNGSNVSGASVGPGSITGDPMLIDPSVHNFMPDASSACVDAGHPSGVYNDPDGTRNDIGAIPTSMLCDCSCHADPLCDGETDILDVAFVIGVSFRGIGNFNDDGCFPHAEGVVGGRTDLNCSGVTDVVDVVRIIDVAFRGADASTLFCKPCDLP